MASKKNIQYISPEMERTHRQIIETTTREEDRRDAYGYKLRVRAHMTHTRI